MSYIIGVDEVGRGCLAGDVYVTAVRAPVGMTKIMGVADSKTLSSKKREFLHPILTAHPDLKYRVCTRSVDFINRDGIVKAVREAFLEAIEQLLSLGDSVQVVRVDGIPIWPQNRLPVPTEFLPKGDVLDWVIGAASIIAKVERDAYMAEQAKQYPQYGWERNAGYGTQEHLAALKQHGLTPLHRTQFCHAHAQVPGPAGQTVFEDSGLDDLFA